jgi:hypothetical protein
MRGAMYCEVPEHQLMDPSIRSQMIREIDQGNRFSTCRGKGLLLHSGKGSINRKIFESQHTAKAQDPSTSETTTGIISPATTGTRGGARGGRGGRGGRGLGGSRGNVNGRGGRGGKGKDVASAEISVRRSGRKAKPSEKIIYEADTAQEKADKETIQRARRRRQHEEKELLTSFPYD